MDYDINVKRNNKFIEMFQKYLINSKFNKRTINKHISNIDLFLNNYLTYYEGMKMEEGITYIDSFMGDWFIRKCMWSSCNTIKETISSLKKFYKYMLEESVITKNDYDNLCLMIRSNKDSWLEEMNRYDEDIEEELW